jgi:hypothetical protein
MLHLTSGSALVVELGLALFCLIDVTLAPEEATRWLPRWAWALALLAFPAAASIGWVASGRSWRERVRGTTSGHHRSPSGHHATARRLPPETIDPTQSDTEHEQLLQRWEDDLRRRERALRGERETDAA